MDSVTTKCYTMGGRNRFPIISVAETMTDYMRGVLPVMNSVDQRHITIPNIECRDCNHRPLVIQMDRFSGTPVYKDNPRPHFLYQGKLVVMDRPMCSMCGSPAMDEVTHGVWTELQRIFRWMK